MKYIISIIMLTITAFLFLGFQNDNNYINDVNEWHSKRIESLKKDTGWLSLAGLFWLEEGENNFGSDESNEIVFPKKAPAHMGTITLNDTTVSISVLGDVIVMSDSNRVQKMNLRNDNQENTTMLTYKSLLWYIVKRSDKYGIRLKDKDNPRLKSFEGIERFPVNINWKIKARLEKYDPPKTLKIPNVLGQVNDSPCPGVLIFELNGNEYRLDPIGDDNSEKYWIIFGDKTNGELTYGAGRFLYVDAADENGETNIDFKRSYNPPCVFSPFATCPLPPEQNKLNIKILAGEKNWGSNHQ